MRLPRETATHAPDLPHKYQGKVPLGACTLCGEPAFELRHVAWEKANEDAAGPAPTLPRETGI